MKDPKGRMELVKDYCKNANIKNLYMYMFSLQTVAHKRPYLWISKKVGLLGLPGKLQNSISYHYLIMGLLLFTTS